MSIGQRHVHVPTTTRNNLIAALTTAGESDSKWPAVRPFRPSSRYRRRVGLGTPGIGHLPPAKRAYKRRDKVGREPPDPPRVTADAYNSYLPAVANIPPANLGRACRG